MMLKRGFFFPAAVIVFLFCVLLSATTLLSVTTVIVKQDTQSQLMDGEFESASITSDGKITIAPSSETIADSEEPHIWSMEVDGEGNVFLATGDDGKLFKVDDKGDKTLLFDFEEPELFSILLSENGNLLVGASPSGKIYEYDLGADPNTTPTVFYETGEKLIWDMVYGDDGLYVATGPEGKILRISDDKEGETVYDSSLADNIMSLLFDSENTLYAATQGYGYIIKIAPDKTVSTLLEATHNEVRDILLDSEGNLYAALNPEKIPVPKVASSTIPDMSGLNKTGENKEEKSEKKKPPLSAPPSKTRKRKPPPKKSQIIRITPEGYITLTWTAPETPINSFYFDAKTNRILLSAGNEGRLYYLEASGESGILFKIEQKGVYSIREANAAEGKKKDHPRELLLGSCNNGVLYRVLLDNSKEGTYTSRTIDAQAPVLWGNLAWFGSFPRGTKLVIETRSGNTEEPDETWSQWQEAKNKEGELRIDSPIARFIQWKAVLSRTSTDIEPYLDYVEVFFLPTNLPPVVKQVTVSKKPGTPPKMAGSSKKNGAAKGSPSGSNPIPLGGKTPPNVSVSAATDVTNSKLVDIKWKINDPDGDRLLSDLFLKNEDESDWKLIAEDLTGATFALSTETIADGNYRVKVDVTDALTNPKQIAKSASLISDLFKIDNTPPQILSLKATKSRKEGFRVTAKIEDRLSLVANVRYIIDMDEWFLVFPDDSIYDSMREKITIVAGILETGEHTLTLKATDREGNSSIKKIILE